MTIRRFPYALALAALLVCLSAARADSQRVRWQSMYGTINTQDGVLRLSDTPTTANGVSYVYYDMKTGGDTVCAADVVLTDPGKAPAFTVRLEEYGKPKHRAQVRLIGTRAFLQVFEGGNEPAAETALTRSGESWREASVTLSYDSVSRTVSAAVNNEVVGTLPVNDFNAPHRFRLDFDETDAAAVAACEVRAANIQTEGEAFHMIVIPETYTLSNAYFHMVFDTEAKAPVSLKQAGDPYDTEYLSKSNEKKFGQMLIRYENPQQESEGKARTARTDQSEASFAADDTSVTAKWDELGRSGLSAEAQWALEGNALVWRMTLRNTQDQPVRLSDIELPMNFNTVFEKGVDNYTERVIRHHFCSLDGSYAYWCRPNGDGGRLVMVPESGTQLEYYKAVDGDFSMYIHAQFTGRRDDAQWLYPLTSCILEPGEEKRYSFRFCWAEDDQGIRDALYDMGGPDVLVMPGMTVAAGMDASLALRCKDGIADVIAREGCAVVPEGINGEYLLYRLRFDRVGEHQIDVIFGDNRKTRLDFFATEPVGDLLNARTKHLVDEQQYKGGAWYDGLFTQWNMETMRMTTPDDAQGLHSYIVAGSDDPSLGKAPLIALKNVSMPSAEEIAAVEYYIEHFVWGGLQRTDRETPRPYAIYGCDSWYQLRQSGTGFQNGGHGEDRMWRTFDYTHIIQLYYYMYEIASLYPDMVSHLDAEGYLMRAFHTAEAFFEIPISIFMEGWDFHGYCSWAFMQGNFGEIVIVPLMDALEQSGHTKQAAKLRAYWETKVKYMVYDEKYPFGSEMVFDTTAFESTHAIAKYGMEHDIAPDTQGFYDPNAVKPGEGAYLPAHTEILKDDFMDFMDREQKANLAARCVMEPAYYLMGSDIRGVNTQYLLSYMTQLGAEGLLDTALNYADGLTDTARRLRVAYASYMAGWAQIHSGESYPWFADAKNKGAASWGYEPTAYSTPWARCGKVMDYGFWTVDGEIDCGFSGGLRMASSVLADDPVFGTVYYGGHQKKDAESLTLYPADGIERRLYIRTEDMTLDLELNRDGLKEVRFEDGVMRVVIENRTGDAHQTKAQIKRMGKTATLTLDVPAEAQYSFTYQMSKP